MSDTLKLHAPITLSTGAIVFHKPYGNGAQEAYLENGRNNKKRIQVMKPNRFYIFDCFGNIAGNIHGYRTMRGAMQQASSPKTKLNRYLWQRAESYFPANRTTKLLYSIRLIEG